MALALGGGGARGLAHIIALEALEDLGIRPKAIAGTSMGAIIGAAYAAGIPARQLRAHAQSAFRDRAGVIAKLLLARAGGISNIFKQGLTNPVLVDAAPVLNAFLPRPLPQRFEDLDIPLTVIAADFYGLKRMAFNSGPLLPAVASSMAIPGLVRPVVHGGFVLVDGGAVDPLPVFDLRGTADIVLAIDVSGGIVRIDEAKVPSPLDAMLGTFQIMQKALTDARLQAVGADVRVVRPAVQDFRVLDFFEAKRILAAAEPMREQIKALLQS